MCQCVSLRTSLLVALVWSLGTWQLTVGTGRVWLDGTGAYRDMVIALHPDTRPDNCDVFFSNLQDVLVHFSDSLWTATEGQISVGEVGVVIPPTVSQACKLDHHALTPATWQTWSTAALRITTDGWADAQWGPIGSEVMGVGVHQPEGCGESGDYITLDPHSMTHLMTENDKQIQLNKLGRALVAAWGRYRWGVLEERGYSSSKRYPPTHIRIDDASTPTACSTSNPIGKVDDKLEHDQVNTSLMYRVDLQQVWGFCDYSTHDPDAPTPHNLICGGRSVWEVMQDHNDFAAPNPEDIRRDRRRPFLSPHNIIPREEYFVEYENPVTLTQFNNPTPSKQNILSGTSIKNNVAKENNNLHHNIKQENHTYPPKNNNEFPLQDTTTPQSAETTLYKDNLNDTKEDIIPKIRKIKSKRNRRSDPRLKTPLPLRKLRDNFGGENLTLPPPSSLVSAHIDSRPFHQSNLKSFEQNESKESIHRTTTEQRLQVITNRSIESSINNSGLPKNPGGTMIFKQPDEPRRIPPKPEIKYLSAATRAMVIALDLSKSAVEQVNMEQLRGGLLRWLWGLPGTMKLSIIAAYNNASYPLTLGPLESAPESSQHLQDLLAIIPYQDEVEDHVYGGAFCFSCVLHETVKVLEGGGVPAKSGIVVIAACEPQILEEHKLQVTELGLTIHTLALCPGGNLVFDQLAGKDSVWVLPSASYSSGDMSAETEVLKILEEINHGTLAWPNDHVLTAVEEQVVIVSTRQMTSIGPYSSFTGAIQVIPGTTKKLLVITTSTDAKVVEITDGDKSEISIIRDTPRRFWAELPTEHMTGKISYMFKFLSSSLIMPLSMGVSVYEKRQSLSHSRNNGENRVKIKLRTSNEEHIPLVPEMNPIIVWAEVTQGGLPVKNAYVSLIVTHLSKYGNTNSTVLLIDDGSTEPDVREGDGIYTRYVTWFPGEGRYSLNAMASDNGAYATVPTSPQHSKDGLRQDKVSTGHFFVMSASVSVTVARVTSSDIVPPSRVTDLTIASVTEDAINITWTAPGGDLDQGSAWQYELKMYTERSALSEERFNTSGIVVYCLRGEEEETHIPTPTPAAHGSQQYCLAKLPFSNLRWYFGLRAIDTANNTGRISNIVSVWISEPTTLPTNIHTDIAQILILPTLTPYDSIPGNSSIESSSFGNGTWKLYLTVGAAILAFVLLAAATAACIFCCKKARTNSAKDPDRPIYKIYVNNAYIQEEDGEIKVVSKGKPVDDKKPGQVQDWVNSLGKYRGGDTLKTEQPDVTVAATETQLTESRTQTSIKYTAPVRFGVLTNGSIMRDQRDASTSSSTSSKPSDDHANDDFKYRDLSETTSNSTTDGGVPGSTSSAGTDIQQHPYIEPTRVAPVNTVTIQHSKKPPLPRGILTHTSQPLPLPGPTVISIHANPTTGYNSDEEGGFRPRILQGPGPRRYLPNHFSSFRYLPPPPEYQTTGIPIDYPTSHTISRATSTLPHGTVRSVKKRRHISFV